MKRLLRRALAWFRTHRAMRAAPQLAAALLISQRNVLDAERKVFNLERRLETRIWMDIRQRQQLEQTKKQVTHWIGQTVTVERALKQATVEMAESLARIEYLQRELKDMERSRECLSDIADGLRNELLAAKATKKLAGSRR